MEPRELTKAEEIANLREWSTKTRAGLEKAVATLAASIADGRVPADRAHVVQGYIAKLQAEIAELPF